jgi:chromosome segregation ATPase
MKILGIICLPVLLAAAFSVAAASVMYRFANADGDPVYSYTLPPGQARHGYQKIDAQTGQVLESVAPQLPPQELAEKLRREQALKECRDELDRIYQLYGSETDIEYALQETLTSLDTRISQLQANLRQASREQGRLRSQAADLERAGREIPRTVLHNIERSGSQIGTLQREIEQRREEQDLARTRSGRELERFRDGTCPEPGTVATTRR